LKEKYQKIRIEIYQKFLSSRCIKQIEKDIIYQRVKKIYKKRKKGKEEKQI